MTLAKQLLSEDGVIFCSIDDKNQAYVKCLFDEVLLEENFLVCICVNRPSEIATSYIVSKHEYILAYCKNVKNYNLQFNERHTVSRGTVGNEDQTMPVIVFPKGLRCIGIKDGFYNETRKVPNSLENVENLDPIIVENGELKESVRLKARWRSSNDMRNFFNNNCQLTRAKINGFIEEIYFENDRFVPQIKKLTYEKIPSALSWNENKKGSGALDDLGICFDYPKSVDLIDFVLNYTKDDALVLDFFAGSGTTGHGVLETNFCDDKNRTFILCQLDEDLDEALKNANGNSKETIKKQIAICDILGRPHKLSEITAERLRRIMTGKCYDGTKDFEWIKKNKPYGGNLDVYEINSVNNGEWVKGKTPFDVIDETLYGQEKFKTIKEKIDWVCGNFDKTQQYLEQAKSEE